MTCLIVCAFAVKFLIVSLRALTPASLRNEKPAEIGAVGYNKAGLFACVNA